MKKFKIFHHIDQKTIDLMYNDYSPVFILSTGRCGSKFIHTLLSKSEEVESYHEAFPNLQYFSNFAYLNLDKKEVLGKMIEAARMELVLDAFNKNKIYVESNQCLTFFSFALAEIFRKSKFVHIIRHPGDFIVSAIKKGWHLNDSIWEAGRIRMRNEQEWHKMIQIEKLAWTWSTTNQYIYNFGKAVGGDRFAIFRIEDIYIDFNQVHSLMKFVGADINIASDVLKKLQGEKINQNVVHAEEPPNMRKVLNYPEYKEWPDKDKKICSKYVKQISNIFGYEV